MRNTGEWRDGQGHAKCETETNCNNRTKEDADLRVSPLALSHSHSIPLGLRLRMLIEFIVCTTARWSTPSSWSHHQIIFVFGFVQVNSIKNNIIIDVYCVYAARNPRRTSTGQKKIARIIKAIQKGEKHVSGSRVRNTHTRIIKDVIIWGSRLGSAQSVLRLLRCLFLILFLLLLLFIRVYRTYAI